MKQYKKTIIGSVLTFIIGTSCCWLSALVIWVGGITFVSAIAAFIESVQTQLLLLSLVLAIFSMYLYRKGLG